MMQSVGELLDQLASVDVSLKCEGCGSVLTLVGKQYTARCYTCGTNITLSPAFLARLKQFEYRAKHGKLEARPKCSICKDLGHVILDEQVDDHLGKYGYRCLCQAGMQRKDISGWPVVPAAKVMAFTPHLRLVQPEDAE